MSQLASLHLSKTGATAQKPSLSQLASMRIASSPPSTGLGLTGPKPPLIGLGSIAPKPLAIGLTGPKPVNSSVKLNLAQLAKMNLGTSPVAKVEVKSQFNLATALKSGQGSHSPSIKAAVQKAPMPLLPLIDDAVDAEVCAVPVASQPSALGRVVTRRWLKARATSVFTKFSLKRSAGGASDTIRPFDFSTPSPDDLIRRRLQKI